MNSVASLTKDQINDVLAKAPHAHLLQSYEWGVFQEAFGERVFRVGIEDDGKIVALATLIRKDFGFGKSYLYCPRGPVFLEESESLAEMLLQEIETIAKREGAFFFRANPEYQERPEWMKSFKKAPNELEPRETTIVDLKKSEDELLASMKSKTRYNVRLAKKRHVTIESSFDNPKFLEIFLQLNRETASRDGFTPHSDDYYRKQFEVLGKNKNLAIYVAFADAAGKKPIASNIVSFFGKRATYVHGTSSNEGRNLMPTFLLQWQAMLDAKERGMEEYDFWGITTSDDPKHPWHGISRFKKGFGGNVVQYVGAYDKVFQSLWYSLYLLIKKVR